MPAIASIDLHPAFFPGSGPEAPLAACRLFLKQVWEKGAREARIITGLGLHGDGTPRLRMRVEEEVLRAWGADIESVFLEQGGAVLRVRFRARTAGPGWGSHLRNLGDENSRRDMAQRELRTGIAAERLLQASRYLEEGDLRRARLKANQILKEWLPDRPRVDEDEQRIRLAVRDLEKVLSENTTVSIDNIEKPK